MTHDQRMWLMLFNFLFDTFPNNPPPLLYIPLLGSPKGLHVFLWIFPAVALLWIQLSKEGGLCFKQSSRGRAGGGRVYAGGCSSHDITASQCLAEVAWKWEAVDICVLTKSATTTLTSVSSCKKLLLCQEGRIATYLQQGLMEYLTNAEVFIISSWKVTFLSDYR